MDDKSYEIKSPLCGRDRDGIFHCECGNCKSISPDGNNKISHSEISELVKIGLSEDIFKKLTRIGIFTLGDMYAYFRSGEKGEISDSDIIAITASIITYFGDKKFWPDNDKREGKIHD